MQEILNSRPCPICNSTSTKTIWCFDGLQYYSDRPDGLNIVDVSTEMCRSCSALFQNPAPSEIGFGILFEQAGASYGSTDGRHDEQIQWLSERFLLTPGGTVFDVGCYTGEFLSKLPRGIRRSGVDIDERAIRDARKVDPEGSYFHSSFENLDVEGLQPDVITMFHVIEHVVEPASVLRRLREISKPSTKLVLETPIIEQARIGDVNGFFSTQHLTHFSRKSLERLVMSSNWTIDEWFEQPDYNGTRLLCSPTNEVHEERSLSHRDSDDVATAYEYVSRWLDSVANARHRLTEKLRTENLVIWGGGMHTEIMHGVGILPSDHKIVFIADSDPAKQGRHWRGIQILPTEALSGVDWQHSSLLVSTYGSQTEVVSAAERLGVPKDKIVTLYDSIVAY